MVESPTYLGALQAWNAYGAQYIPVRADENGMIVDELEAALRIGPKFIYVLPNFQNPSGSTLSLERRKQLVELADQYGVPIVEDDPYGQLRYEGDHIPSVVSLDSEYRGPNGGHYSGNVIYLSTFSKLLAPGLRLAWVIAPPEVIRKLVMTKQAADLHTASFNQYVAYEVGKGGFLDEHVKVIRATYKERRDVMFEMMEEMFPPGSDLEQTTGRHVPVGCSAGRYGCSRCPQTCHRKEGCVCARRGVPSHAAAAKNTMRHQLLVFLAGYDPRRDHTFGDNVEGIDQRNSV